MNPNTRACIAYVAGKAISGSGGSHIYDYQQSKHLTVGGSVSGSSVGVFDYGRKCHSSGTLPQLFDYGNNAHISIDIKGSGFQGYDYGSGNHFMGSVNGSAITVFDYGESQHFNYSL